MSDNLRIYEAVRAVPPNALREIQAGRLKGKSDINPMWRIRTLTEIFGPCGIGWKYEITEKKLEEGANNEIAAFVDIKLYVKINGEWSEPIPGTGGSAFVTKEKTGLYVSDECFKMALTDAISVACKALGFAADVYWNKDSTKYNGGKPAQNGKPAISNSNPPPRIRRTGQEHLIGDDTPGAVLICYKCETDITKAMKTMSMKKYGQPLCVKCQKEAEKRGDHRP